MAWRSRCTLRGWPPAAMSADRKRRRINGSWRAMSAVRSARRRSYRAWPYTRPASRSPPRPSAYPDSCPRLPVRRGYPTTRCVLHRLTGTFPKRCL
jgi:hypothetical protein